MTAGRFELSHDRYGVAVGRFVFGKTYLARPDAVPFDAVELRLSSRVYETTLMNGVLGALRDAGPDYWGRRIIEKHAHKAELGELDYLLNSADDPRLRKALATLLSLLLGVGLNELGA